MSSTKELEFQCVENSKPIYTAKGKKANSGDKP